MESKYSYQIENGWRTGAFNIYQGKRGAIYLVMSNNAVMLSKEQVEVLIGSSVYDLKDFSLDAYLLFYS